MSALASAATGFAIGNNVLIIAGALDGASGFILSIVMSKAMNRSFTNILFGAFSAFWSMLAWRAMTCLARCPPSLPGVCSAETSISCIEDESSGILP